MDHTPARDYNFKDVEMIVASSTIIDSAIAHKTFLQTKRINWTDAFFTAIKTRIDTAAATYLGADTAQGLRQSTTTLLALIKTTRTALAELKVQIEEDFSDTPARRNEILNTLGYALYDKALKTGDQEAMINLLTRFTQSMTPALKTEITTRGTAPATIDAIIATAQPIMDADIAQEGQKGTRPALTAAAVAEFNAIYDTVSSIAKLAAKFLKDNPAAKDQFSFAKVVRTINGKPIPKRPAPAPTA